MSVGGGLVAVRDVETDVDGFRLNGIAISSDGQTIYLTAVTPGGGGVLLSVPAFGEADSSAKFVSQAVKANAARDMDTFGKLMFSLELTPAQGLGPLFNDKPCAGCHSAPTVGGSGIRPGQEVKVAGKMKNDGSFTDFVARAHSVSELGVPCDVSPARHTSGFSLRLVAQRGGASRRRRPGEHGVAARGSQRPPESFGAGEVAVRWARSRGRRRSVRMAGKGGGGCVCGAGWGVEGCADCAFEVSYDGRLHFRVRY